MKAEELRIGNYVADIWNPDVPRQVQSLAKNLCIYGSLRCKYDKLLPIHLTEEWLLKFGFTKRSTSNNCNKWFKGENPVTHDWLFSLVWLVGHPTPFYQNGYHMIKYVHQLQNLYYALTGEELCTQ